MPSTRTYDVLVHRPYPWMERARVVARVTVELGDLFPLSEAAAQLAVSRSGVVLGEGQVASVRPVY